MFRQREAAVTLERDAALPRFVTDAFNDYLRCGHLEYGFIRVKCDGCRHEHLVAFSCKRRKTLYRDRTTHFVFEPIEFLAGLAALH